CWLVVTQSHSTDTHSRQNDIDIWIPMERANADRVVAALEEFGFGMPELKSELFLETDRIVRMGFAPVRIEVTTTIDGVEFNECYERRVESELEGCRLR